MMPSSLASINRDGGENPAREGGTQSPGPVSCHAESRGGFEPEGMVP